MKRKFTIITALFLVAVFAFSGCGKSTPKGALSNKYITIKKYTNLPIDAQEDTKVTDETVESYIDSKLESRSEPVTEVPDREVKKGDTIIVDCSAKDTDGNPLAGTELKDHEIEIGSGTFIPGWEDACIGKKFGEEFKFDLKFPEEYAQKLAGKKATWTVKIKGLKTGENKPKLDKKMVKEFAKEDNVKATSVKEYKKALKKKLQEQNEYSLKENLKAQALVGVEKETKVKKYPKDAVDKKIAEYEKQYKKAAKNAGQSYDEFLKANGTDKKTIKEQLKTSVESEVKRELVCELLLDKAGIKISSGDYNDKYDYYAKLYQLKDRKEFIKQVGKEQAKKMVEQDIVAQWLVDHAKVTKHTAPKDEGFTGTVDSDKAKKSEKK